MVQNVGQSRSNMPKNKRSRSENTETDGWKYTKRKDKNTNHKKLEVSPIEDKVRENRLTWFEALNMCIAYL